MRRNEEPAGKKGSLRRGALSAAQKTRKAPPDGFPQMRATWPSPVPETGKQAASKRSETGRNSESV